MKHNFGYQYVAHRQVKTYFFIHSSLDTCILQGWTFTDFQHLFLCKWNYVFTWSDYYFSCQHIQMNNSSSNFICLRASRLNDLLAQDKTLIVQGMHVGKGQWQMMCLHSVKASTLTFNSILTHSFTIHELGKVILSVTSLNMDMASHSVHSYILLSVDITSHPV